MKRKEASAIKLVLDDKTRALAPEVERRIVKKALLSRKVEERLLELFSQGKLFGTVHTCIGQEFSGAVVTEFLEKGDSIFSNHRCHGHFLSFVGDVPGLMAELMGKPDGVCGGKGGSQHLCKDGFYSNGIQGSIVPVSAGLAFARKIKKQKKISVVFIGDGTLGEGVIYEAANIASKWNLPLLIVLENNLYAQSTSQKETLAGDIQGRFTALGIKTARGDTWNWRDLFNEVRDGVEYVRGESKPFFMQIDTYRLKAHSKGDDNRDRKEVEPYEVRDPINQMLRSDASEIKGLLSEVVNIVDQAVNFAENSTHKTSEVNLAVVPEITWNLHQPSKKRVVKAINEAFMELMARYPEVFFIGEDVLSPYGGAFKVSQGLSDAFSGRVLNTPISEGAIAGVGAGLALEGFRPFIEFMFGDFIGLAFDQVLNSASKFEQMYNGQISLNAVFRTPMGGGRGYGPTHSQTLDRHFFGIPGLRVVAINNLMEPMKIYEALVRNKIGPTILIENKLLYSMFLRNEMPLGFEIYCSNEIFPTIQVKPSASHVDLTLIGYGGMTETLVQVADRLFEEHDIISRIICPTQIFPFDVRPYFKDIGSHENIVVVEEGQGFAGFGAEILSQISEHGLSRSRVKRIFASPKIIPASGVLEKEVLPNVENIIPEILEIFK